MYPAFAQAGTEQNTTSSTSPPGTPTHTTPLGTPTREDDELDLSAIREDFNESNILTQTITSTSTSSASNPERPTYSRTATESSTTSAFQTTYETAPTNFGLDGKWQPPHTRTAVQIRRYVRRCAPLLMADAVRASDIVICNGKRMRINWREERLEDWRLQPPKYTAHDFDLAKELQKKKEEVAATAATLANMMDNALNIRHEIASSTSPSSLFSETSSSNSSHDDITPCEERSEANGGLAHLDLVKTSSAGSAKGKTASGPDTATTTPASRQKAREVQRDNNAADMQVPLFCF
jgi:hypothetical protein